MFSAQKPAQFEQVGRQDVGLREQPIAHGFGGGSVDIEALAVIPHDRVAEVDGIGIIYRGFTGTTPNGRNWDEIANSVAGKQVSGYMPMGRMYMSSRKFLQGDGGWNRIVWMPRKLKLDFAADKQWIATEVDVKTMDELKTFLNHHRWHAVS